MRARGLVFRRNFGFNRWPGDGAPALPPEAVRIAGMKIRFLLLLFKAPEQSVISLGEQRARSSAAERLAMVDRGFSDALGS